MLKSKLEVILSQICPSCDGKGKTESCMKEIKVRCAICDGKGYLDRLSFMTDRDSTDHEIYSKFMEKLKEV